MEEVPLIFMGALRKVTVTVPATWREVLEEFSLNKQAEARAARTIKDYRAHVAAFFEAEPDAWEDYHRLKQAVVRHFAALRDKSASFFNLRREYLKAFFAWCVREGYLPANPVDGIPKRKNEGRPRAVPEEGLKALLDVIDQRSYVGRRDYALALLQLDCGLRPSEALSLRPSDFNLRALEVTVPAHAAKTRVPRTVVYSPTTAKAILRLLAARPKDWDDSVPVFASQDGRPLRPESWAWRLRRYAEKAGVNARTNPYALRHTSAIMFLRGGGSAFALQRQLGHASLVMTRRYVHMVEEDLHREHAQASPVARIIPQRSRGKRKLES